LAQQFLEIKKLQTYFYTRDGVVKALDDVDLTIQKGQFVGIVGESGCGKSTLALSILRIIKAPGKIVGGEIFFEGQDLLKLDENEIRSIRGKDISIIFQDPTSSLNPVYTIGDQIGEAIKLHQDIKDKTEIDRKVIEILKLVGISDAKSRLNHYPHEFSGGMRQRVMIAIAISCNPKLLIADEPTTSLDVTIQAQVLDILKTRIDELGSSILLITHNLGLIAELCSYVYVMYAGHIVEQGNVFDIFKNPGHPYTKMLMQAIPKIGERDKSLVNIPGTVPELIRLPPGCIFAERCDEKSEQCTRIVPSLVSVNEGHKIACLKYRKSEDKNESP
jgi:oligopeptide/dipeptide ABC transporter ATP-binding protein